jgi:hypothetical protein
LREFIAKRVAAGTDNLYAEPLRQVERRLLAQVLE